MLVVILVFIVGLTVLGIVSVFLEERNRKRVVERSRFKIGDKVKLSTIYKHNTIEQRFIDRIGTVYSIERLTSGKELIAVRYDNAHLYFNPIKIEKVY